ncbi:microtubule-associated protein futsch-like isoform X1 [Apis mellifera carnica]|nr:microtubule-associated protein futsch-like isoform X1 [Apis mellifera carnica]
MDEDNDYKDSENSEDTTISSLERAISEETPKEEILEKRILSDQEESTEGVLKFTDELPKDRREDGILESKKSSEIVDNTAHDYVDDNYEPDNYKERESSNSNSLSDEKSNKEMLADGKVEDTDEKIEEDILETTTGV